MIALADILRRFWPAYRQKHGPAVPRAHVRAAEAILRCRTAACGTVFYQCGGCGTLAAAPVSCGHRACNACGGHRAIAWEARQRARLLPVPCHLITCTIPAEFRALFRSHQRLCYDLFFKETAATLLELAADPEHLGGAIGMTGVLHTWTRDLRYHPHLHYIVPAAALTEKGIKRPRHPAVLLPAKVLAARLRTRMRAALKAADFKLYMSIPSAAWKKAWITDARPAGSGPTALGYLARYTQKTALDSARVTALSATHVTIRWIERKSGKARSAALTGEEFLQRFLLHVLPRGFVRIRHFGWLSPAAKTSYQRVRTLLKAAAAAPPQLPPRPAPACPCCGQPMSFLQLARPARARPPPPAEKTP